MVQRVELQLASSRVRVLSREQLDAIRDALLDLSPDPKHIARRRRDRAARNRECGCGAKLDPRSRALYCWSCAAMRAAPPLRVCPGDDGEVCGEDITGTGRIRCEVCANDRGKRLTRLRVQRFRGKR